MAKRTAEILDVNKEFTVILREGEREVTRYNHLPKRAHAEFHGGRWVREGRYIIPAGGESLKPRTCADKKCGRRFVPKKRHGKYCSKRCGDRVRHERSYKRKVG